MLYTGSECWRMCGCCWMTTSSVYTSIRYIFCNEPCPRCALVHGITISRFLHFPSSGHQRRENAASIEVVSYMNKVFTDGAVHDIVEHEVMVALALHRHARRVLLSVHQVSETVMVDRHVLLLLCSTLYFPFSEARIKSWSHDEPEFMNNSKSAAKCRSWEIALCRGIFPETGFQCTPKEDNSCTSQKYISTQKYFNLQCPSSSFLWPSAPSLPT